MRFVERLLTAEVPSDPSIRADGAAVAVTVSHGDLTADVWHHRIRIFTVDGDDLFSSVGPSDRAVRFAPRGAEVAWIAPDERGIDQVWARVGADTRQLTGDDDPVRRFAWDHMGRRIAVVAERGSGLTHREPIRTRALGYKRDGAGFGRPRWNLRVVHVETGTTIDVGGDMDAIGDIAWSADDDAILVTLPIDDRQWAWDVWRLGLGGERTRLTRHTAWEGAACPIELESGDVVYVGGEAGPRHAEIRLVTADGGSRSLTAELDRNVTVNMPAYPGVHPIVTDGAVYFTANDGGMSRLASVSLAGGPVDWLTVPDTVATGVDIVTIAAGPAIVTTEATMTSLGRCRVIVGPNAAEGSRTLMVGSDEFQLPWACEKFESTSPDGKTTHGWLLRSECAADGPAPLLLDIHGGPHNVANPVITRGNLHRALLAEAGWHVLMMNFRGSDGFGEAWYRGLEATGGWASADIDDLEAAVDAAIDRGIANADRLAITGYSYGGLLTAALTTRSDRFRAAALGGAPVDLRAFLTSSDLGPVLFGREVGGTPWGDDAYDGRSPIRQVGAVRTPTLVVHGADDQRVPVSQAEQWFQSLRALDVPTELVVYPGASHGFVTLGPPGTVADVGTRVAEWLMRWNVSASIGR